MQSLVAKLEEGSWGLARARAEARSIERLPGTTKGLVAALFTGQPELRKRAADVARRITEQDATPLWPYADELAGLLTEIDAAESRTRWHLALVVARVAHTPGQRLRSADSMCRLAGDESTVVRCSAIEGLGLLAEAESSLRKLAAEIVERALHDGSRAEQSRARAARKRLIRAGAWAGESTL